MKQWFKFVGLCFFSDRTAKEGVKRGYVTPVLITIISVIIFFCGLLAADRLPFYSRLSSAEEFKQFATAAFQKLDLKLENGILSSGGKLVDTFGNDGDRSEFSLNGYGLAVDARPASAYDKFNAYAVLNDGTKLDYDEFLSRPDAANLNYKFELEYTDEELVLTEELTQDHEQFLEGYKGENSQLTQQYAQVKEQKGTLSAEEYASQVYALYVKAKYPDLRAYEPSGGAPTLRNFYNHNYIAKGEKKYLLVFSDVCLGSFETPAGTTSFYGYYGGLGDGAVEDAESFIIAAYDGTLGVSVYMYAMNVLRFIPYLVLAPVIVALLAFCILRLCKVEWCKSFGSAFKVTAPFLLFSSLIGAVLTFACGYLTSGSGLFMASLALYFAALLVRAAVLVIRECVAAKRTAKSEEIKENLQEAGGDDTLRG